MSKKAKDNKSQPAFKSLAISPEKKRNKNIIYLIFLICFLLYGNTIPNNYSMDDELVTLNHKTVSKGIYGIPQIFKERYVSNEIQSYEYRPIVLVTFAIEHQFTGGNPHFSHFINILLYALTGVVLFFLLSRLFLNHHWILPAAVTFLFLIHPIHSEVVASLKNRDELLSFLFSLLTIHSFILYIDTHKKKQIIYGIIFFIIAVLSKKSSVPLIVTIPLILYYFKNVSFKKAILFAVIPFLMLLFYFICMQLFFEHTNRPGLFYENPMYVNKVGLIHKIPVMFYCIGYYIKLLIFPYPLLLYYGYNVVPIAGWDNIWAILSLITLIPVLIYCLIKLKEKKIWMFGFLYFIINAGAFSNIIPMPGVIGERYVYGASLGFFIMIAALFIPYLKLDSPSSIKINIPNLIKYSSLFIVIIFGVYIFNRNKDWSDHLTSYTVDVEKAPNSTKLHALIGGFCMQEMELNRLNPEQKRLSQVQVQEYIQLAKFHFKEALKIHPDYVACLNNLGTLYYGYLASPDSAYPFFLKVVDLDPKHLEAHFNLGSYYEIQYENYKAFEIFAKGNNDSTKPLKLNNKEEKEFEHFYLLSKKLFNNQKNLLNDASNIIQEFINANRQTGGVNVSANNYISSYNKTWNTILISNQMDTNYSVKPGNEIFNYLLSNQAKTQEEFSFNLDKIIKKNFMNQYDSTLQEKFYSSFGHKADSIDFIKLYSYSYQKKNEFKSKMIKELYTALFLKRIYSPAYTKLNTLFTAEKMWDSLISLNKKVKSKKEITRAVDLNKIIGNGYLNKGDKNEALKHYELAVKEEELIFNKIYFTSQHQSAAGNNIALTALNKLYLQTKESLYGTYNYMGQLYQELDNTQRANECFQKANNYKN